MTRSAAIAPFPRLHTFRSFETNARAQQLERHSTRDLRWPARWLRGVPQVVVVVVISSSRPQARDSFAGASKMAFVEQPFARPAWMNVRVGKSIVACCSIRSILRHDASDSRLLASIDWSIHRDDSSDPTRSSVEIPRGLFLHRGK